MDSPHIRNIYNKRTPKQKPTTTNENLSKQEKSKSITNRKKKNNVKKGGYPNNFHMDGRNLIEQVFS